MHECDFYYVRENRLESCGKKHHFSMSCEYHIIGLRHDWWISLAHKKPIDIIMKQIEAVIMKIESKRHVFEDGTLSEQRDDDIERSREDRMFLSQLKKLYEICENLIRENSKETIIMVDEQYGM